LWAGRAILETGLKGNAMFNLLSKYDQARLIQSGLMYVTVAVIVGVVVYTVAPMFGEIGEAVSSLNEALK
jgi:hypothetical protein